MAIATPRHFPLMPIAGLAIVLVAGVTAILLSRSVSDANRWVNHSVRLQVTIAELGERLSAQEAAFRGYLIRGDAVRLVEVRTAERDIARHLQILRAEMADNPVQEARVAQVRALIEARLRFSRGWAETRARLGHLPPITDADVRQGTMLSRRFRAGLARMFAEEEALLVHRQRVTQVLTDCLSIALAATVLVVVVVACVTVGDARKRYLAMIEAHREARAAARATQAEMAAREAVETQLRQSQKMESIGQLSGGIAHDFNNMLAVIVGSLDMAERRARDPAQAAQHLRSAREGAERAAALVARLLAFSRRQPLAPSTIAPNMLVGGMVEMLERTLGERIAIDTHLAPATWPIHVDAGQLENAILNLALNARDAMEQGGTLTIATENRTIDAAQAQAHGYGDMMPGDYATIAICDEGAGMSEEVRARAFDPFFTTKPVGKGTGLGLSQVFGFVKQSGGHVAIEAREGGGSVVRLFLPRHAGEARAIAPPTPAEECAGRGERILVVEDDERVRLFSVEALRELGYDPVPAEHGAAALALLERGPEPALLFTDVVMPGIGGAELAARVRARKPDVRVLFTTGYARGEGDGRPGLDPAIGVLGKPFTVGQLAAKVRAALDG